MAFLDVKNVRITGLSACVPKKSEEIASLSILQENEAEKLIVSTGIERRRVADKGMCTSDLCFKAAEQLIADLSWNKNDIDCLIFVTQTPDYFTPATSCILQDRLGLSEECYTLDISLGCSGWVYGLSALSSLLSSGNMKKGLLLVGDITLAGCSPKDKSTYPLFGDAGSATALEFVQGADGFKFHLGTDGSGHKAIYVPDGCLAGRNPVNVNSFTMEKVEPGIERNRLSTILDGMDVFSFGITKVPETVDETIEYFSLKKEKVNFFIFHQANKFLNEKIRKKLQLPQEKVPYSLKDFGNTSSATIPLTMATELKKQLESKKLSMLACGFGVGLSWGTVAFETDKIVVSELVEV